MKVALISDVHANLPALEAVLAHANERDVDTIWNLGDLVCFGAFTDEVVQLLHAECDLTTSGEYDRRVLRFQQKQEKWRRKRVRVEYLALQWAHEQLSKKSRKYLRFLSREERVTVKGHRILLTHGCPDSANKMVTASTPEKELSRLAQEAEADVVLCGHSHHPLARQSGNAWFVNPGSAGMGSGGDPRVSYAVLEISSDGPEIHPFKIEYDVDRLVAALRKAKLPEAIAQMFADGQDMRAMLASERET